MKSKSSFPTIILLVFTLLVSLGGNNVSAQLSSIVGLDLWSSVVEQQSSDQPIRLLSPQRAPAEEIEEPSRNGTSEVLRRRFTSLDTLAFSRLRQITSAQTNTLIALDLFTDATALARVNHVSRESGSSIGLTGVIEKTNRSPGGYINLVQREPERSSDSPVIFADIQLGARQFEIRPLRGGAYEVLEINPYAPKPDRTIGFKGDSSVRGRDEPTKLIAATPNRVDTVDVLVVYTTASIQAAETEQNLQAIIDLGAQKTNTALSASLTESQIRVVGKVHLPWWEEGNDSLSTDLTALQNSTRIKDLRQQFRADVVVLIRAPDNIDYGIAFCQAEVPLRVRSFAVVDYAHIARYAVMGHEIGHTLGCDHNYSDKDCGIVSYAYGQWFYGDSGDYWGTMMSYKGSRVLFYSNPNVLWDGQPTGLAGARDNARRIRETKATIAAFF